MNLTSQLPDDFNRKLGLHVPNPGEALIKVVGIQSDSVCKAPTFLTGKPAISPTTGAVHRVKCSATLYGEQATRYTDLPFSCWSTPLHRGHNANMSINESTQHRLETNDERRRRKLMELCEKHGRAEVAKRADTAEDYIRQIVSGSPLPTRSKAGEKKPRQVGDDLARAIERGFDLPRGWMDNDFSSSTEPVAGAQLSAEHVLSIMDRLAFHCDNLQTQISHSSFAGLARAAVASLDEKSSLRQAEAQFDQLLALLKVGIKEGSKRP